uniref:Uncharacterized protein n=1 Tax=Sphaerodactylus townsendi TaxID=933632 RepID=A0ACB8F6Y6_9SAUR
MLGSLCDLPLGRKQPEPSSDAAMGWGGGGKELGVGGGRFQRPGRGEALMKPEPAQGHHREGEEVVQRGRFSARQPQQRAHLGSPPSASSLPSPPASTIQQLEGASTEPGSYCPARRRTFFRGGILSKAGVMLPPEGREAGEAEEEAGF